MRKRRETARIREVVQVFIKHGVRDGIKNVNNPEQIRMALEELGPTFIKIGQILSTRPDILPASYIEEFQKLHDNVKPEKFEAIVILRAKWQNTSRKMAKIRKF